MKRHDRGGPSSAPSSTTRRASGRGASSQLQRWLMTLPEGPFGQLGLGKVLMRKPTRMVRVASSEASGLWAAVFRLGADSTCTSSVPSTALAMSGMPAVCHQAPPGCGPDSELHESLQCLTPVPLSPPQVRRGVLGEQTAIFKLWDVLEGPEVAAEMQTELQVYERLRSLQVRAGSSCKPCTLSLAALHLQACSHRVPLSAHMREQSASRPRLASHQAEALPQVAC